MNLKQQITRFENNFTKNAANFGTNKKDFELDFLFFIEIPLDLPTEEKMQNFSQFFQEKFPEVSRWNEPQDMGITLALPGRRGTHFQGNHIGFMEEKIKNILEKTPEFTLTLAGINCFETVLFREVLDPNNILQKLHEEISEAIPFAQNPAFQYENFLPHISVLYLNETVSPFFPVNFDRSYEAEAFPVKKISFGKAEEKNNKLEKIVLKNFEL